MVIARSTTNAAERSPYGAQPGVADVQEMFMRQLLAERLQHRQSADTGIEDAYGFVTCNHLPADAVLHSICDNRGSAGAYYSVNERANHCGRGGV